MYKNRFIEKKIVACAKSAGAVVITGPRQAGKTSLLLNVSKMIWNRDVPVVSFDAPSDIVRFRQDPDLFFLNNPGPLLLDEVQHVPEIFSWLKRQIDKQPGQCLYGISGSQSFSLMKGVSESLAGRAMVFDLWPFCVQEARDVPARAEADTTLDLFENPDQLAKLAGREYSCNDRDDVAELMLRGGYPPVLLELAGGIWLESYRRTYIQRDVRSLYPLHDLGAFDRMVMLAAGRTGQILNKADVSAALGVDNKTVDNWLRILEAGYQFFVLQSYHVNTDKRLVKRPKLYCADIGMALHLQGIRDTVALLASPQFGALFETFVVMELRKLYGHAGRMWDGFFWRQPGGVECDLVLPRAGYLLPIEIKHASRVRDDDLRGLRAFRNTYRRMSHGGMVISMNPRVERLAPDIWNVPLGLLLNGP